MAPDRWRPGRASKDRAQVQHGLSNLATALRTYATAIYEYDVTYSQSRLDVPSSVTDEIDRAVLSLTQAVRDIDPGQVMRVLERSADFNPETPAVVDLVADIRDQIFSIAAQGQLAARRLGSDPAARIERIRSVPGLDQLFIAMLPPKARGAANQWSKGDLDNRLELMQALGPFAPMLSITSPGLTTDAETGPEAYAKECLAQMSSLVCTIHGESTDVDATRLAIKSIHQVFGLAARQMGIRGDVREHLDLIVGIAQEQDDLGDQSLLNCAKDVAHLVAQVLEIDDGIHSVTRAAAQELSRIFSPTLQHDLPTAVARLGPRAVALGIATNRPPQLHSDVAAEYVVWERSVPVVTASVWSPITRSRQIRAYRSAGKITHAEFEAGYEDAKRRIEDATTQFEATVTAQQRDLDRTVDSSTRAFYEELRTMQGQLRRGEGPKRQLMTAASSAATDRREDIVDQLRDARHNHLHRVWDVSTATDEGFAELFHIANQGAVNVGFNRVSYDRAVDGIVGMIVAGGIWAAHVYRSELEPIALGYAQNNATQLELLRSTLDGPANSATPGTEKTNDRQRPQEWDVL